MDQIQSSHSGHKGPCSNYDILNTLCKKCSPLEQSIILGKERDNQLPMDGDHYSSDGMTGARSEDQFGDPIPGDNLCIGVLLEANTNLMAYNQPVCNSLKLLSVSPGPMWQLQRVIIRFLEKIWML